MKKIVIDLDNTITSGDNQDYRYVSPNIDVIKKLHEYKLLGFEIIIFTARNMRTFEGRVGKINIHTVPTILDWLDKHQVPFDELVVGKPWCGHDGFYVDDKAIRPQEFIDLSYDDITRLLDSKP